MRTLKLAIAAALLLAATTVQAELFLPDLSGSEGSDDVLHVVDGEDRVIDLSEAADADWNTNNQANAGSGVYDKEKWAVVFKYSSVTVEEGGTVTFVNHRSRAPVVWLVSGDVTINGTVSLDGADGAVPPALAEPGPGGFRGGMGTFTPGVYASAGFGVGGGGFTDNVGYGGSYGSQGSGGPQTYGNPSLIPLTGGSGGGGDRDHYRGGGAGGGAILIVSEGVLTINGALTANGGDRQSSLHAGAGSGGGLRIVADVLAGTGNLSVVGGSNYSHGGVGRIRTEYVTDESTLGIAPPSPSTVKLDDSSTALLWPPEDGPQVKIVSIGGESVSDDPRASFGTHPADAVISEAELSETNETQVVVETINVESASKVQVRVTPRTNVIYEVKTAERDTSILEDSPIQRWTANIPVQVGHAAVQVKVIRP